LENLLSVIPLPYRILALLVLVLAIFSAGFFKGLEWQQGKDEVARAKDIKLAIEDANRRTKATMEAQFAAEKRRDAINKKSAVIEAKTDAIVDTRAKYQECKLDADLIQELVEARKK
jgi:hypothetical protein